MSRPTQCHWVMLILNGALWLYCTRMSAASLRSCFDFGIENKWTTAFWLPTASDGWSNLQKFMHTSMLFDPEPVMLINSTLCHPIPRHFREPCITTGTGTEFCTGNISARNIHYYLHSRTSNNSKTRCHVVFTDVSNKVSEWQFFYRAPQFWGFPRYMPTHFDAKRPRSTG